MCKDVVAAHSRTAADVRLEDTTTAAGLDFIKHVCLGPAQKVDSLDVTWPSGKTKRFTQTVVNRVITLSEGTAN